jgi:hypothetical protein
MPEKPPSTGAEDREDFDVVLMHANTEDGEGARVLRARPGRLEAGEVRPMAEGKPLMPGGEVVRLERRKDAPALYDVHVECKVPDAPQESPRSRDGPPQVATKAYREAWARTFGRPRRGSLS